MKKIGVRQKKGKFVPQEKDFDVVQTFSYTQRGFPNPYSRIDFFATTQKLPQNPQFWIDLQTLYLESNQEEDDYALIVAFSPAYWNNISPNHPVQVPEYSTNFQKHYRTNIQLLFLLKKHQKTIGSEKVKANVLAFFYKYNLTVENQNPLTEGVKQPRGRHKDTVFGAQFADDVELPRDPFKFFQHGLIGYENPYHLGGSYLMAQKIDLDWNALNTKFHHMEQIVGRKDINDDSTIFSQNWCPHSHIKSSRIKDRYGNPVSLVRQTKPYFDEEPIPGQFVRERGSFFLGFSNSLENIEKIVENQHQNSDTLIKFFKAIIGGILYVPNLMELNAEITLNGKKRLKQLSQYHRCNWSEIFPSVDTPSASKYLLYNRIQYMQNMGAADEESQINTLLPPTPRTLRVLSRTFSLWQDTWYYDRKQAEMGHLRDYMMKNPKLLADIPELNDEIKFDCFQEIPIQIRQALAVYFELGHLLTSSSYGCRGQNQQGVFGAATFHVEPEDILAGGQANLTFGQGKHLIHYLTDKQLDNLWYNGTCLSQHSGVGHIVPYMEEIFDKGLEQMIKQYFCRYLSKKKEALNELNEEKKKAINKVAHQFLSSYIALWGLKRYLLNYEKLCIERASQLTEYQVYSKENLMKLAGNLAHIASLPPKTLTQGAQLALTIFITLHVTGEPVSIGRLDHLLGRFVNGDLTNIQEEDQEVIDNFWIKVGEKVNLNKAFFEDHQIWGNLAMGGMASNYPQGASFNQWGHQITIGGCNRDRTPSYNPVTIMCIRAARRIPTNAPCLGLRVDKNTPKIIFEEAAKCILSGGAHPILLNDDRIIPIIQQSGKYTVKPQVQFKKEEQKEVADFYANYDSSVSEADATDFSSDGCYEFLISGKSWFCLSGLVMLLPLEYLLNEGKNFLSSGPRFIHGQRMHHRIYKIDELQKGSYENFEEHFWKIFHDIIARNFTNQLSGFGLVSDIFPTSLLNVFTHGVADREADFYSNGTRYNLFAPQFTGIANLVNSLWNIKKYVFENQQITLKEIRQMLLNNWGQTLTEPFVPEHLPSITRGQFLAKCKFWRLRIQSSEQKFGLHSEVSAFGDRIAKKIAQITIKVFSQPLPNTFSMLKTVTNNFSDSKKKFGIQIMPGCGTFQNYIDSGSDAGPSFDGRLKGATLAQDFSLQGYLSDQQPSNKKYDFKEILKNYKDPNFSSGSVLDFNIDEDFSEDRLVECLEQFAKQDGPNIITVTVCDRKNMEEMRTVANKDLLRFRMGGWSQFGVAMFPQLLEQHIRRIRTK